MFSLSIERCSLTAIAFFMLAAMVFAAADGVVARVSAAGFMPDDQSRLILVGAAGLGFLLGAFGWAEKQNT